MAESSAEQLTLHLALDEAATFDGFLAVGAARATCAALQAPTAEALQFLHGPAAVGKSHLLQAACHHVAGAALYLPLRDLVNLDAGALLSELESSALVAIDDVDAVAGDARWEEGLFHLVNRCRAAGTPLLFAAAVPPSALPLALPDLHSRLAGGLVWALPAYDDAGLRDILRFRAERRGLGLSDAVLDYLGSRARRSLVDLLGVLDELDRASLRAQRAITVPFVREVLGA